MGYKIGMLALFCQEMYEYSCMKSREKQDELEDLYVYPIEIKEINSVTC